MHFPSISHSEISVTLSDKGLVKCYHFVLQYNALLFDTTSSFLSPLPWLRNEKDEKKRILLNALTARLPSGESSPIAILEHLISEHNAFSITLSSMKLKEMEQNIFGKPNCGPKLAIVDYSKAVIKAELHDSSGDYSTNSWTRHTE